MSDVILSDDENTRTLVFSHIDKNGPKAEADLHGKEYKATTFLKDEVIILLLAIPLVALGIGLERGMEMLHGLTHPTIRKIVFAAGIIGYMIFCRFISARVLFRSSDLLDALRRASFRKPFVVGASLGALMMFVILLAISEEPGVLLHEDFQRNVIFILAGTLVCAQTFGISNVILSDKTNFGTVNAWIAEWRSAANTDDTKSKIRAIEEHSKTTTVARRHRPLSEYWSEQIMFSLIGGTIAGIIGAYSFKTFGSTGLLGGWIICWIIFMRNLSDVPRYLAVFVTMVLTFRGEQLLEVLKQWLRAFN